MVQRRRLDHAGEMAAKREAKTGTSPGKAKAADIGSDIDAFLGGLAHPQMPATRHCAR